MLINIFHNIKSSYDVKIKHQIMIRFTRSDPFGSDQLRKNEINTTKFPPKECLSIKKL